jgi:hypothetical protein
MTYRTSLSEVEFADAMASLGFSYPETSCFATTYTRGSEMLSIESPASPVYEDLEIATDFRLSTTEMATLHAWKV